MKNLKIATLLAVIFTVGLCPIASAEEILVEKYSGELAKTYHHRKGNLSDSQKSNLTNLAGTTVIHFSKHETIIYRSKIYTWKEIEPAIFFILKEGA